MQSIIQNAESKEFKIQNPGQEISVVIIFIEFSQNCPELCGILREKKMHRNEFISVPKWGKLRENSAEMRETEGKFCGKNLGMEISTEMRETEGKSCTLTFVLLYVDNLIANKTWKNGSQQKIQVIFEISGGIIFHGLEYLIRLEVVFCFTF